MIEVQIDIRPNEQITNYPIAAQGDIIAAALPGYNWGEKDLSHLFVARIDDPAIEAKLRDGGPEKIMYPYAEVQEWTDAFGHRQIQMVTRSTKQINLSKLTSFERQVVFDPNTRTTIAALGKAYTATRSNLSLWDRVKRTFRKTDGITLSDRQA